MTQVNDQGLLCVTVHVTQSHSQSGGERRVRAEELLDAGGVR